MWSFLPFSIMICTFYTKSILACFYWSYWKKATESWIPVRSMVKFLRPLNSSITFSLNPSKSMQAFWDWVYTKFELWGGENLSSLIMWEAYLIPAILKKFFFNSIKSMFSKLRETVKLWWMARLRAKSMIMQAVWSLS